MSRDSWLRRLGIGMLAWIIALAVRALGRTWRVRVEGENPLEAGEPLVAALWHRGLVTAAYLFRDRGIVIPVSLSRDGDLGARVAPKLGFAEPARGSTSRGALGLLRQLIRRVRGGETVAILADGPRGPARRLKPGILAVARASGGPIHPVGISARPGRRLPSWDRSLLPYPFARVSVHFGPPVPVPRGAGQRRLAEAGAELARELDRLTDAADAALDLAPDAGGAGRG